VPLYSVIEGMKRTSAHQKRFNKLQSEFDALTRTKK